MSSSNPQTLKIIVPSKFISLTLHLMSAIMNIFSYHDNILVTYPNLSSTGDTEYIGGKVSFLACIIITIAFIIIQILIIFGGRTMFRDTHNVIYTSLHFLGAILLASYGFQQWQFYTIWSIWAACSLLPFIMEILVLISVASK